jgi:methyl coenzyme M reductase system subunit A2
VVLAQVLIREPHWIIMDEQTRTTDPVTKQDVRRSIVQSRDEMDEIFIVVSHDMDFVADTCDRFALMEAGKIVQTGDTREVLAEISGDIQAAGQ